MNTKVLLAGLAGGIVYFLLGWLVWGILLANVMTPPECIARGDESMIMWAMALSCIIWGLLVAIICSRWAGVSTFAGGANVGAILGAFTSLSWGFSMYSMTTSYTLQDVGIDTVANLVVTAIVGGVVGLVLGRGKA